jgi:ethanolamine ammonia-lyase small subunit
MEQEQLRKMIREIVRRETPLVETAIDPRRLAKENIARWLGERKVDSKSLVPKAKHPEKMNLMMEQSPARLGVWRAGTRYLTKVALKFRADHAVAKDAVYAELLAGFAEKNSWIALQSEATSKEEFLLRPDLGRKLNRASQKLVLEKGLKNADVQITVADGLSPWAAERHSKAMVDELVDLFKRDGLTVGPVFCVKYSRIAIQDEIGEMLNAKVSMIILGERPGLGGGDSLSNYIVYGPKGGTVNAKKSMISNIHPKGHTPIEAAHLTFSMVKKMLEQKCSGIDLKI